MVLGDLRDVRLELYDSDNYSGPLPEPIPIDPYRKMA
jgi:hypothetical protein